MSTEHSHAHGHAHAPASYGKAFAVGSAINLAFVIIEATYGVLANSTALIADAGHNLSDVLGLLIAWAGMALSRRLPTSRFTYGLRSASILAALFNAMVLLIAVGAIAWEAVQRLATPAPVAGRTVMIIAAIGIMINGGTAALFMSGRHSDINLRGAFLHMAADAAVSAGVVIAGAAILLTGWHWIDPAVSFAICAVIFWSTWNLLKDSVRMSMGAVPASVDPDAVRTFLLALPGVEEFHDLHIWPISTTETALTCHLVIPSGHPGDSFLMKTAYELYERFHIGHSTFQIELSKDVACKLAPADVV